MGQTICKLTNLLQTLDGSLILHEYIVIQSLQTRALPKHHLRFVPFHLTVFCPLPLHQSYASAPLGTCDLAGAERR